VSVTVSDDAIVASLFSGSIRAKDYDYGREFIADASPSTYHFVPASSIESKQRIFIENVGFLGQGVYPPLLGEEATGQQLRLDAALHSAHALEDFATLLETESHDASAARVRQLLEIAVEEADDGEKEPQVESLRSLTRFLLLESEGLPRPTLVLGSSGLFTATWNVRPSGGMVLQFVSDDEVVFTGVANIREGDPRYREINSNSDIRTDALEALSLFAKDLRIDLAGAGDPSHRPRGSALHTENT